MAETLKLGNGIWGTKDGSLLAYNSENGNYKPLPFDFTRASSATVVNKAGLIETVQSGIPRIDFLGNTNGALLLEPQRTNLYNYSNDTSLWIKTNFTTTNNYATSPDGTTNAFRGVSTSNGSLLYISSTGSAGTNTISIYAKSNTASDQKFRFFGNGNTTTSSDQTVTQEWQRFEYTETFTNVTWGIKGASVLGTNDILFYGIQHEVGSYPTSYIPTQGSTVTRVAETCSQTPPSGIIGQTEGTMFCEVSGKSLQENSRYMSISDFNDANKRLTIYQSGGLINVYCSAGATFNITYSPPAGTLKIAVGYKSGDYVLYVNGVNAVSSTESAVVACSDLGLGVNEYLGTANPPSVGYSQAQLYNTRLSNSELATLTSL